MPSDNEGVRLAHITSDDFSRLASQSSQDGASTPYASSRRLSAVARDSAKGKPPTRPAAPVRATSPAAPVLSYVAAISGRRESVSSILDDPFFLNYDPAAQLIDSDSDTSDDVSSHDSRHERNAKYADQRWLPPRRESLTVGVLHPVCRLTRMAPRFVLCLASSARSGTASAERWLGASSTARAAYRRAAPLLTCRGAKVDLHPEKPHSGAPHGQTSWVIWLSGADLALSGPFKLCNGELQHCRHRRC